jgi:flagellar secretion chaperone FliS
MRHYHQAAIESASSVQLIVALYDGLQRFLMQAAAACDAADVQARRTAARRAADIVIHLQACLRMEIGGEPAAHLSDFYTAVLAAILRASAAASSRHFLETARQVRVVRDAWQVAAQDRSLHHLVPRDLQTWEEQAGPPAAAASVAGGDREAATWSA